MKQSPQPKSPHSTVPQKSKSTSSPRLRLERVGFALISPILLVLIWVFLDATRVVPTYIVPPMGLVFERLFYSATWLWREALLTFAEALAGLFLATASALVLALLMRRFKALGRSLMPLMVLSQAIPLVALAPLFVLWFGLGTGARLAAVSLMCFFPILINTYHALVDRDAQLEHGLRLLGANSSRLLWHVDLPRALPSFLSGLRIAASYAVGAAVIAEWLGGAGGLGVSIVRSMKSFDSPALFAAIILMILFTLVLYGASSLAARKLVPWHTQEDTNHDE